MLNPFLEFLRLRWNEGCRNAAQLWREMVVLGFRERPTTVRHWIGKRRRAAAEQDGLGAGPLPPVWPVPRGYRLARLLMTDASKLNAEDRLFKRHLLDDQPALGRAIAWATRLNALLRREEDGDLDEILRPGDETMLARFAAVFAVISQQSAPHLSSPGPPAPSRDRSAASRC